MRTIGNRIIRILITIIIVLVLNVTIILGINFDFKNVLTLSFELSSQNEDTYQIFYSEDGNWTEENCTSVGYSVKGEKQKIKYYLPKTTQYIRLDLGTKPGEVLLGNVKLTYSLNTVDLSDNIKIPDTQHQISTIEMREENIFITTDGEDPYIAIDIQKLHVGDMYRIDGQLNVICKIISLITVNLMLVIMIKKGDKLFSIVKEVKDNRRIIWKLAINDFHTKYAGSYLGITWAFVQPIVTVLVYWFVFQVGFRSAPVEDFPFVLWLVAGIVPWFFYSEAIVNASNSLIEYSYLVKKVLFKISILPVVKVLSSLFVHMFFVAFTILLFALYGYMPSLHMIQVVYYTLCIFILVLGLSYLTAAVQVFFKDLGQIINIFMQVGMWMTPIMWSYSMIDEPYQWILKINPMFYIVQGYRDSLIDKIWFWQRTSDTFYFWIVTLIFFGLGCLIFKKLKVHFADVL